MSGRSHRFLGITSTFGSKLCLAQGHKHGDPGEEMKYWYENNFIPSKASGYIVT